MLIFYSGQKQASGIVWELRYYSKSFVMLILYYINGPAQEYQEIQSNQTENSPLPCPSINVKSSWSSRAELAHVREDRHGVSRSRQSHSPSRLPGISISVEDEDGVERWIWSVKAACKQSYSIEWNIKHWEFTDRTRRLCCPERLLGVQL